MTETIEIRATGPPDREAMLLMYRGFEPLGAAQGLPPVSEEGRRAWIDRLLDEARNWGAFHSEGRLLGHVILVQSGPAEAEIAFFVHQSVRCRRIGTRLVVTALAAARERGYQRVWASVCADNVPAMKLLRGRGFGRSQLSFPTVELELLIPQPETTALAAGAR
jgi:ribosomal protein S18 acetylase RimI-like enzyme